VTFGVAPTRVVRRPLQNAPYASNDSADAAPPPSSNAGSETVAPWWSSPMPRSLAGPVDQKPLTEVFAPLGMIVPSEALRKAS
jgi:hypothetical protein